MTSGTATSTSTAGLAATTTRCVSCSVRCASLTHVQVSQEFPITVVASRSYVDFQMVRYTYDGSNPNAPLAHGLQLRTGFPNISPTSSRPTKMRKTWLPQQYDGSTWLYVIDVGGGGVTQSDGLTWSQDWGYFYPPRRAGPSLLTHDDFALYRSRARSTPK